MENDILFGQSSQVRKHSDFGTMPSQICRSLQPPHLLLLCNSPALSGPLLSPAVLRLSLEAHSHFSSPSRWMQRSTSRLAVSASPVGCSQAAQRGAVLPVTLLSWLSASALSFQYMQVGNFMWSLE